MCYNQSINFLAMCTAKKGQCWMLYKANQWTTSHTSFAKPFKQIECSDRPKPRIQNAHSHPTPTHPPTPVLNSSINSDSPNKMKFKASSH